VSTGAGTELGTILDFPPCQVRGALCPRGVPWSCEDLCSWLAVLGVIAGRYNCRETRSARPRLSGRVALITWTITTFDDLPTHVRLYRRLSLFL
jgi:hypothetical protein